MTGGILAVARHTVTTLMAEHNPEWRQRITLAPGIVVDMPKPFAMKKLFENKCVTGWKFNPDRRNE